ncbi:hypothetical protein Har1130_19280 [Haloarcula sp. CBA1130]|uniref:hypothetical protein n=1 Tax=unclassified Haloarcula TaxID=2624677 RepID=UPI001244BE8E|nr:MULTISPECIES: hypothetical protein [unclassified Haloarcula]KAA9396418.1 hypothetical protein Har1130_19280 [Haloarcula sp. CBA1130]KAA9397517.1 hypothetical protein Har1129_04335 [Haloarcula sp. CBA1129]
MTPAGTATLGDFGAGGPRSDVLIDTEAAAQEAVAGEWEFLAAGNDTIGWHIPDTGATILLKGGDDGWTLERATKLVGTRSSLDEGLELAHSYMMGRPEGASTWR